MNVEQTPGKPTEAIWRTVMSSGFGPYRGVDEARETAEVIPLDMIDEQGPLLPSSDPLALYRRMRDLQEAIVAEADQHQRGWRTDEPPGAVTESWFGAANLAAYMALRGRDVREAQV